MITSSKFKVQSSKFAPSLKAMAACDKVQNYWKMKDGKWKICPQGAAFSLIELLVVITVFSILAILVTQSLMLSLRGSRKSEALSRVRENLDYAFAVMERQLHNAKSVDCPSSTEISYYDYGGNPTNFTCSDIDGSGGSAGYVASGSARLTIGEIDIIQCTVTCNTIDSFTSSVTVSLTAEDIGTEGAEGAQITTQTNISLRAY